MLTLPVFARALDASEYGALEIYTVGIAVAIVFADAGLSAAAQRSFYDYRDDELATRRAVITTAFADLDGASAPLAAAAIYVVREPTSRSGCSRADPTPTSWRSRRSPCRCSPWPT